MNTLHIDKPVSETRVLVAMSGGVDSSAAAALLKDEGYDVVGATLQLRGDDVSDEDQPSCRSESEIADAKTVAGILDMPHHVVDLKERFQATIMEDFADAYVQGETPVPCVACNRDIKFGGLWDYAKTIGADALVTGHYVRWAMGEEGAELRRGADPVRDQTYFLFALSKGQLANVRFPLGDMSKDDVRALAARFDLPVADKPASQDICFVRGGTYAGVVEAMRPGAFDAGDIVDVQGNVLGRHTGIINYTVGQRRRLGIAAPEPHYVLSLDPIGHRVIVGPKDALLQQTVKIREVNWLGRGDMPQEGVRANVKLRSTMPLAHALVRPDGQGGADVTLDKPFHGAAPGQACVMYDDDRLLGGGWITRS